LMSPLTESERKLLVGLLGKIQQQAAVLGLAKTVPAMAAVG